VARDPVISDYLNRENRDRNQIVQDYCHSNNQYEISEISRFADGISVAFVVTISKDDGTSAYVYASHFFHNLTGYLPSVVLGKAPSILQCEHTNLIEARRQMAQLKSINVMNIKLVNRRKDGSLFGNHIRACAAPKWHPFPLNAYFGFLSECAISDCV